MDRKIYLMLCFVFGTIFFGESMVGYTYNEVVNKYSNENLRPMGSIWIGGFEIKSLSLERQNYRVMYTFDRNNICTTSSILVKNKETLQEFIDFYNERYTNVGSDNWVSEKNILCIKLFNKGTVPTFQIRSCSN